MIVPQVNNNGTQKSELIDSNLRVADALREALEVMKEATPNGRDFQTLPNGMHLSIEARKQHGEQAVAIQAAIDHFYGLAIAISDQD